MMVSQSVCSHDIYIYNYIYIYMCICMMYIGLNIDVIEYRIYM